MQTYENYYRSYYQKNRERIEEMRRQYKKIYNHQYYEKNKQKKINYNKAIEDMIKIPEKPKPIESFII